MPLFSVITPINSIPDSFEDCCLSLMNQTLKDFEWIIVINGRELKKNQLENFVCNYSISDIKIIETNDSSGPSKARNLGINNSIGNYLVFLDSDDYLFSNFLCNLSRIVLNINHDQFAICSFGTKFIKNKGIIGRNNLVYKSKILKKSEICLNFIGSISGFIIKNNLKNYFHEKISLFEDYNFYIELMNKNIPIISSSELKYFYSISETSLTKKISESYPNKIQEAKEVLLNSSRKQNMYHRTLIKLQVKRLSFKLNRYFLKFLFFTLLIFLLNPRYFYFFSKREFNNLKLK